MRQARADHLESDGGRTALRITGEEETPARPAWRMLMGALGIAMALWATGILELPASSRRMVDWVGAFAVLTVFVVWVRVNAGALAALNDELDGEDRVSVRMVRSRRSSLDLIGSPHARPLRRRRGRVPPR